MQRKACTKCGIVKPLEDYHRGKRYRDGRRSHCKTCIADYQRRYREENREKIAEYGRRYYEENREEILARERRYYEENREHVAERNRRYREENREEDHERKRRYHEENREVVNAKKRIHRSNYKSGTAVFAVNHYQPWALDEDEFIMEDNGMTVYQKAMHIGRTYESVRGRREKLRRQ